MPWKESDLKVVYGRVLKFSLLLALCLHLVGFLAKREVALHPFTTGFKPDTVFVFPAKPPVPEEPPPIERPNRQVTSADDDDADAVATIDKDKDLWDRPPPMELPRDAFIINYDEEPVAVKLVEPVYPKIARMAGHVVRVEVAGSAQELLSSAAAEAVSQWHFTPGKVLGKPVAVKVGIPITFKLK
jgi:outer membrane biosynthesis protein TonB